MPIREKICHRCGRTFLDDPANHPRSPHFKRKYCGSQCRDAAKSDHLRAIAAKKRQERPQIILKCEICSQKFQWTGKAVGQYKRKPRTCSRSCRTKLRIKTRPHRKCLCGKVFQSNGINQKHCSRKCSAKYERDNNPDRIQKRRRESKYKLLPGEYEEMHDRQKGLCLICLRPETMKRKGKVLPLCVDHCHDTGKVRGLICSNCNSALGKFRHNTVILARAYKYMILSNPQPSQMTLHAFRYLDQDPLT